MRFLSPLALAGLALITLPVLIHLLVRRHARRLDFPSLKFLRETPSFRLRPRRIQQPLLLALRVAALALLITGLARPLISSGTQTKPLRIILLDASLSMSAQGRANAAKEEARNLIDKLAAGERAAILAFSSETILLSGPGTDTRKLAEALELYRTTGGAADYAKAFRAAAALLDREPPGPVSIELISDFQASGLSPDALPQTLQERLASAEVSTHPVGAGFARNAFLADETSFAVERGREIRAHEIIIGDDGRSGERKAWQIDSGAGAGAEIEWRTEETGQITVRLRTHAADEFDADDERFLVLGAERSSRALLLESNEDAANTYLRAALEATASELGQKSFTVERKRELPLMAGELNSYALVVSMLGQQPRAEEMHALALFAQSGGTVWFCMGRALDASAWNVFAQSADGRALPFTSVERKSTGAQPLSFGAMDAEAQALRFVEPRLLEALQAAQMREGYGFQTKDEAATIMRWNDGTPALVQTQIGGGRFLLLAASPARESGELGINAAFPALVSSIARSSLEPREPLSRTIGEPVNLGLAPEASVKIVDGRGKIQAARARDLIRSPAAYFGEAGIYRLETDGLARYLAFNSPAAESEPALAGAGEIKKVFGRKQNEGQSLPNTWHESAEQSGNLWRYFLLAAFLLLILELFVWMKSRNASERMKA